MKVSESICKVYTKHILKNYGKNDNNLYYKVKHTFNDSNLIILIVSLNFKDRKRSSNNIKYLRLPDKRQGLGE